ncbi:MAG TPA: class III signal peptide-containing protein [Candidatus Olsenella pullicola]|nr:class III signal peptide-containing protein [Candidatus Olsenella pullicola]
MQERIASGAAWLRGALADERGQGTTEYAILVGVLVVIAILAIVAFRERVAELWSAISDGINSL